MIKLRIVGPLVAGSLLALGSWSVASAQDAPPATATAHEERAADPNPDDDLRFQATAGVTGNYGNARNISINLAAQFALRRSEHSFLAEAGWVYGLAATRIAPDGMPPDYDFGDPNENTNNFTARLRYDFFVTPEDAVFAVARVRRDPFARLEPRVTGQVGYLRNFFREENHRFWGEAGYDFTYDNFGSPLQVDVDDMGNPVLSNDRMLHSLRLFLGYTNHLNDTLTYDMGLEALMRLTRPEHWRFEWTNQLRNKIEDWLQISLDLTVRVDSLPPGQAEAWNEQANQPAQMTDVLATLNLVGAFDLDGTPEAEPEPEPEPETPACPACNCPDPEPCPAAAPAEPEGTPETPEPPNDETETEAPGADEPDQPL